MIRQLDPKIVAQIAAGEVIERPENIIKELIENSIDAGADRIAIQIKSGGLDMVSVSDNGTGITPDQLELAFRLHTTSKVKENLFKIPTLGFRGEALSSITAVSIVDCKTRVKDKPGRHIILEGGQVKSNEEFNCQIGTKITVNGIFFNTPARRKFLKTANTERKRIMNILTSYCLMYPHINFTLDELVSNQQRRRLECPVRQSMLSAAFDVLGAEIASNLIKIKTTLNTWTVDGYISKPLIARKDRAMQFLCINGRPVHHLEIQHAIEVAYGSQLMRSSHPVIILNISGPVDGVDYNIHPRKSEVRFRTDDPIVTEIRSTVEKALEETWELPKLQPSKVSKLPRSEQKRVPSRPDIVRVKTTIEESFELDPEIESHIIEDSPHEQPVIHNFLGADRPVVDGKRILGHIMQKFALIDAGNELWLMDVHAADERVKFEMYERQSKRKIMSQSYLSPIKLSLSVMDKQFLLDSKELLNSFGLKISDGGGTELIIHEVPVFLGVNLSKERMLLMLSKIVDELNKGEKPVESLLDEKQYTIVANLACHGSVRSGYDVDNEKLSEVLGNLMRCHNPWTCAHGRPTILRIDRGNLESWFKR